MKIFSSLLIGITIISLVKCVKTQPQDKSPSQIKSMKQLDMVIEYTSVKLKLPKISALGLDPIVNTSLLTTKHHLDPNHRIRHYKVIFEHLNKKSFDELIKYFHGEREMVFTEGKTYDLIDFMPRFIQATVGHRFDGYYIENIGTPNQRTVSQEDLDTGKYRNSVTAEALFMANCWNTVYEFLRNQKSSFKIYVVQGYKVDRMFLYDSDYSDLIQNTDQLQFGDILTVISKSDLSLLHTAIYIDGDLFYEKPGFHYNYTYRFTHIDDIKTEYPDSKALIRFRRFGKKALPDATEVFMTDVRELKNKHPLFRQAKGIGETGIRTIVHEIQYEFDPKTNRFAMKPDAFTKKYFTESLTE